MSEVNKPSKASGANGANGAQGPSHFALTDFDREVLSVLLAHGGWNASARMRLAVLAQRYGVSSAGLSRVLAGLADAARDGRLHAAIRSLASSSNGSGTSGAQATTTAKTRSALGAAALVESSSRPALSRSDRVLIGVVSTLLVLSVLLLAQLVLLIWGEFPSKARGSDAAEHARAQREAGRAGAGDSADRASALSRTGDATDERGRSGREPARATSEGSSTSGRPRDSTVASVPVSYPRAPTFKAALDSPAFMQAIAEARVAASRLEAMAGDPRSILADRARWADLQRTIAMAWPRLDRNLRRGLVERTLAVVRPVDDASLAEALLEPLRASAGMTPDDPASIRAGAWGAGIVGAIFSEPGLSPEVHQALASIRVAPADGRGDAFERFAAGWLDRSLTGILERVGRGTSQEDFDRMEAWIEAQQQLRTPEEANDAWLRAIDAIVRRPMRTDLPGTSADLLGRLLTLVDWRPEVRTTEAARRRWEQWLLDASIEPARLWALASILRQHRSAPWFDADMMVGERATREQRQAALSRILAALRPGSERVEPVPRAPRELLDRRSALLAKARSGTLGERQAPGRQALETMLQGSSDSAQKAFAHAVELDRLAAVGVVGAWLLDGRSIEAAQRMATLETAMSRPPLAGLAPGGRVAPPNGEVGTDGLLARRLEQAQSLEERIDAIRRRRVESASDLGPIDAARLVREALVGEPPSLRSTAQGVIIDRFGQARRVAQELVDQFTTLGAPGMTHARFIERLTGERMPPHTNPRFRATALSALLGHRLRLSAHPWHGVEALLVRSSAAHAERVEAEGGGAESLRDVQDPVEALEALAVLLRQRAETRAVLRPVPATLTVLDRRDRARLSLAADQPQRLVAMLWRVFELEVFIAVADRPTLSAALTTLVERAMDEASHATTVLEQAVIIERARIVIQSLLLDPGTGGSA
ncbi:MAG: hypothetical protein KF724_07945 [Phycisphaeraceae bacterium]|nr:hypothetical protein [Phycisphaeraceae bacterium]